jgi:hypothetical protein
MIPKSSERQIPSTPTSITHVACHARPLGPQIVPLVPRWTAALTMRPQPDGAPFEYACHEGNHSKRDILGAARKTEKETGDR